MIFFRWFLVCGLCAAAAAPAGSAPADGSPLDPLDLPAAIQLALQNNRELNRNRLTLESRGFSLRVAEADFDYRLRPDGVFNVDSDTEALGYGLALSRKNAWGTDVSLRGGYSRLGTDGEDADSRDRVSVRLQVSQPLFRSFGPLVQREPVVQAGNDLLTARRQVEQQKADLIVSVVQLFEDLLRLERQIASDETFRARVRDLYRLTAAREKQGRATRIDTLRVQLQLGQADGRLANNRERYASRFSDFTSLLGLADTGGFSLAPPPLLELEVAGDEDLVGVAFSNRLEVAQALQDIDDARRGIRLSRRDLLPRLRVVGRVEQFGEGDSFSDASGFEDTGWSVGVAADSDFIGSRERAALGQRIVGRESAQWQLAIVRDAIRREVRQDRLAYARTRRELDIAENNMQLATDRVRLARRLFELGRGDNFNVTDAEDAFLTAQQQWLTVRAEASVAGYRLLRTLGTLVEFPQELRADLARAVP